MHLEKYSLKCKGKEAQQLGYLHTNMPPHAVLYSTLATFTLSMKNCWNVSMLMADDAGT